MQQYCGLCCKWWRHTFWNSSSCIKYNVATHTTYTHVVLFPARNLHNNIERCCFLKTKLTMLSYEIFDIYLPRNKWCYVFPTRWQSRRRGLIFKAKITKDTNRDEVYLTSNPESTKSKLHYTLNCMSQQNGDLCCERIFFRESRSNASFSVNSLFLFY